MNFDYHRNFTRGFEKLPLKFQNKTQEALRKFKSNPFDPSLKNHALTGKMHTKRAFSVTGSIRVIFQEFDDYTLILLLDIGNHPHVYGD